MRATIHVYMRMRICSDEFNITLNEITKNQRRIKTLNFCYFVIFFPLQFYYVVTVNICLVLSNKSRDNKYHHLHDSWHHDRINKLPMKNHHFDRWELQQLIMFLYTSISICICLLITDKTLFLSLKFPIESIKLLYNR